MIKNNEIHLFTIPINQYVSHIEELVKFLSSEEIYRGNRFRFEKDWRVFTIAHAALRILLGNYLGISPKNIQFGENLHGKPEIQHPKTDLYFNLSHSGDYALIGLSKDSLGVDIEVIDPDMASDDIVERYFSPSEFEEYQALAKKDRRLGFYQAWTRKEAYVKALGEGLICSLQHFSVTLTPNHPAKLYQAWDRDVSDWHLYSFEPHKDYCAAVAWKGESKQIVSPEFFLI